MCFKRIATAAFFAFTLFSIVATSKSDGSPAFGTYRVQSDCVSPVKDQVVSVSGSSITTGGVSFTDFGFPSATLANPVTGTVGAVSRSCKVTYGNYDVTNLFGDTKYNIYSCFDNGSFACTILFEEQ